VLLYGGDEKAKGVVTLRDMVQGRQKSQAIAGHEEWIKQRPGQVEVARGELVTGVRQMLAS
jgi:histidyl-tRNA synthetase